MGQTLAWQSVARNQTTPKYYFHRIMLHLKASSSGQIHDNLQLERFMLISNHKKYLLNYCLNNFSKPF
jgi:hypothetical protein